MVLALFAIVIPLQRLPIAFLLTTRLKMVLAFIVKTLLLILLIALLLVTMLILTVEVFSVIIRH